MSSGSGNNRLLAYLRLEEGEETAALLKATSLRAVGVADGDGVSRHYWSYPTPTGVSWVSCCSGGNIRTEVEHEVPPTIKAATAPREAHPLRQAKRRQPRPVDRSPVAVPVWVPDREAPACNYYPVWEAAIPFPRVLACFRAKAARNNVGYPELSVCIKLTSGRYAQIDAPESNQHSIWISLELSEDAESRQDDNCIGFVHSSDIRELLEALGEPYAPPGIRFPYQWRD